MQIGFDRKWSCQQTLLECIAVRIKDYLLLKRFSRRNAFKVEIRRYARGEAAAEYDHICKFEKGLILLTKPIQIFFCNQKPFFVDLSSSLIVEIHNLDVGTCFAFNFIKIKGDACLLQFFQHVLTVFACDQTSGHSLNAKIL
ncbi:hypothetical protein SDC9_138697 [bioreactor metagenome]|uniref:Uncharacterized protein n=1 Tax=bioreactor metagenome TaxID=1076179 RepID=A0A645DQH7_9ZZZZ